MRKRTRTRQSASLRVAFGGPRFIVAAAQESAGRAHRSVSVSSTFIPQKWNRAGQETRGWTSHRARAILGVLEQGQLQRGNTENFIEELTIAYQYWRA